MKTLWLILPILLMGCAEARIEAWSDKEITACGNRYADKEDIEKEAQKSCKGKLTFESGYMKDNGFRMHNTGNGNYVSKPKRSQCLVYTCS